MHVPAFLALHRPAILMCHDTLYALCVGRVPVCHHIPYIYNHQRWYAKWKLSWNMYTLHIHFCTFGADLYAQLVLINKISTSELTQKFIRSVFLVG